MPSRAPQDNSWPRWQHGSYKWCLLSLKAAEDCQVSLRSYWRHAYNMSSLGEMLHCDIRRHSCSVLSVKAPSCNIMEGAIALDAMGLQVDRGLYVFPACCRSLRRASWKAR